ncbi:AlbA family DNA-binding domain-containing protein [Pedobacter sp. GR22-6]|uniref:AlbA family DNA-binding domain-containing protein n=1 Tax=Pedobacter sp. GR22-6 TaxID=3127957 RepID=UPI00307CDD37
MTTEELESVIEGQTESQNLDFKADIPWSPASMVKDFIAMANVRDGGSIVIGVGESEEGFIATGVCEENLKTYKVDEMKDKLASYTDPSVDFKVTFPTDKSGNKYVVIKVLPFREIPVISRVSIPKEINAHTIYYRNTDKRWQSAPVSNSNDLRDIIETAVVKMMQKRLEAGFTIAPSVLAKSDPKEQVAKAEETRINLEKEAEFEPGELLKNIMRRGYWKIQFIPVKFGDIPTVKECLDIVSRSRTRLNWDFPHVPPNNNNSEKVVPLESGYEMESDLGARKEYWRLYQSEQFLMYRALIEDWYAEDPFRSELAKDRKAGVTLTIYSSLVFLITETFEFLSRLYQNGLFQDGVKVSMTLYNLKDRKLRIDALGRMPFSYDRITGAEQISLTQNLNPDEILTNGLAVGNQFILSVLDKFAYNPPPEMILGWQKDWLGGTFQH